MARKGGKASRIYMSTTEIGTPVMVLSMAEFNFDGSADDIDTTCFEDGNKTSIAGYPGGSGTFSGFWDDADPTLWESHEYCSSGGAIQLEFYPDKAGNTLKKLTCLASVSCGISSSSTGAVKVSGKWSAKGTITNTLVGLAI